MATGAKKYVCKDCKKEFEYDELPFLLKAEKGESRPERCPECKQIHGVERGKIKVPYFEPIETGSPVSHFGSSQSGFASRGERKLEEISKDVDLSEIEFGITEKDILAFYEKLENNQVVVVVAPTGSGKSTFLPLRLIIPPKGYKGNLIERLIRQGQIIITEPLTSAVERIPAFIAEKLLGSKVGPGNMLGLRHGGGKEGEKYDRWNIEVPVTDGSLRNWIREGKLSQYSLIMVDEAHQRSCNIETILMLLKNELARYPNLKVVISSATVNAERFRDTFKEVGVKADILNLDHSSRRKHNYYVHFWRDNQKVSGCGCWLCQDSKEREKFWRHKKESPKEFELSETIARFVMEILQKTKEGSILVFLHGEAFIKDTAKKIKEMKRINRISESEVQVLTVYRRLGEAEVERRFNRKGQKGRVLITTNIAETSHTLDDVVYVIDCGYIKESEWDPATQISKLPSRRHSQDGCRQRWGRTGRNCDGYVFCLYTEEEFKGFDPHTNPEITRSCLDEVMLTLSATGVSNPENIPWLVKPEDLSEKK